MPSDAHSMTNAKWNIGQLCKICSSLVVNYIIENSAKKQKYLGWPE